MDVVLSMFGPTAPGQSARGIAEGIRDSGGSELLFFTSLYHGYRLPQRRYPHRAIYSLETDRVFYEPDLSLYRDSSVNPEVRAYGLAMVRDIVGRYEIDALMLDKIPRTMLELGAFGGAFDPPLRTVGSFCFCEHCRTRAAASGLDLAEVQAKCREIADRSLAIPPHIVASLEDQLIGDTEIPLLLLEEPLEFRFATAVEFVGEIGALARSPRPGIVFQAAFVPPTHIGHDMTSPRSWLAVQSYKLYAEVLDEIYSVVHWGPDVVRFETQRAVAAAGGRAKIVTSMRLYGPARPEEVPLLAEAALAGGSEGVSFLGYDVATDELPQALRRWVESKRCPRLA